MLFGSTRERVTLVKAAELAGISLYDFMSICKTNQIPVIDITRDELLEELAGFNLT
jgi:predicted HTH domain antitoxin